LGASQWLANGTCGLGSGQPPHLDVVQKTLY